MSDRKNARRATAPASLLPSRQTVDEAIAILLAQRQAEVVATLRAALDRPMPEAVQELRAALQGLRTALTLCARWADTDALDEILRDAHALSDTLGETRHWDVLVAETLIGHIDTLAGIADVAALTEAAATARHDSYRRVRALLDGPLPQKLLLGLAFLVSQQRWRSERDGTARKLAGNARARAKREIARLDKRLKDRGKRIRHLSEEKRQDLRIDVGHLAETIELLGGLWPRPTRIGRYGQRVQTLRSALDGQHDARTALRLLDRIAEEDPSPVVQRAVGAIGGWSVRDQTDRLAALEKLWREFRSVKRFW